MGNTNCSRSVRGSIKQSIIAAASAAMLFAMPAAAADKDQLAWLNGPGFTGEWGGLRSGMEESGIALEAVYVGEFARNADANAVTGNGLIRTLYHTSMDLTLTIDTEKAGLWEGGTLFVYGLGNNGDDPTAYTGDMQGYSNIEAPDQYIIHEVWLEQQFADNFFSFLIGLHDMNSEFYVSDYGALFLNSSFGIGPELSGNVAASLFPKAALGGRIRVTPTENTYIQAAIYDGDSTTRGFKSAEGKFYVAELGLTSDTGAYKAGYWQHTADKTFGGQTFGSDYGLYAVVDQQLVEFDNGATVGAFLQYGYTPKKRNEIFTYVGAGFYFGGIIPSRADDELGVAFARADYHAAPGATEVSETALEVTYKLAITPWLSVQPSYQWIDNPSGNKAAPTVKSALLRFEVVL